MTLHLQTGQDAQVAVGFDVRQTLLVEGTGRSKGGLNQTVWPVTQAQDTVGFDVRQTLLVEDTGSSTDPDERSRGSGSASALLLSLLPHAHSDEEGQAWCSHDASCRKIRSSQVCGSPRPGVSGLPDVTDLAGQRPACRTVIENANLLPVVVALQLAQRGSPLAGGSS